MSEVGERAWRFYVDDMIGFAEKVLSYTQGFDQPRLARSQTPVGNAAPGSFRFPSPRKLELASPRFPSRSLGTS